MLAIMILALVPLLATVAVPMPIVQAERTILVTGFDRVRIDGPFVVNVRTGRATGARVHGDARTVDDVVVRVEGRTLSVRPARNDRGQSIAAGPLRIELTTQAVGQVAVSGGGAVTIDRLRGARVDLAITGTGRIASPSVEADRLAATVIGTGRLELAGAVRDARFQANGAGAIEAAELRADTLFVRSEGPGSGRFNARNIADVTGLGTGELVVDGTPQCRTGGTATIRCGTAAR